MSANDELQAHLCEKMLEFYGDVANNVAQLNSQDLTEQWKKGELERGLYYIKILLRGRYDVSFYYGNDVDRWIDRYDEEISEVMAPVPSYEEFDNIIKCYLCAHEKADRLEKESQQLKELLKECGRQLEEVELCRYDVAED